MKQHLELIRLARLLCSPAPDVYADLKANADLPDRERFWQSNEDLENELLARDDRLIDLALAQFGTEKKIVSQLFARTAGATDTVSVGIRLACLSNQVVDGFWSMLPATIMTEDAIREILHSEDDREAAALFANPRIEAKFLANLFSRKGRFAELPEERWIRLIVLAGDNKRILTCRDTHDGPDMGHYDIQKSILTLVKTAPTTPLMIQVLYSLLMNLNPSQTRGDGELETTLARWVAVELKGSKALPEEGFHTGLTFIEEFRCLIAALYGKSYANNQTVIVGSLDASDPVLRAAFYGNSKLSEREMKAAYGKDGKMFVFSSLWNDSLFYDRKLRGKFEEQYLSGDCAALYRRRLLELKDQWPNMNVAPVVDWIREEAPADQQSMLAAPSTDLGGEFADLKRRFGSLEKNLLWAFVILGAILLFKH